LPDESPPGFALVRNGDGLDFDDDSPSEAIQPGVWRQPGRVQTSIGCALQIPPHLFSKAGNLERNCNSVKKTDILQSGAEMMRF